MLTPANEADRHQGQRFINQLQSFLGIEKALVDSAYQGIAGESGKITVEVSGKISNQKGFVPIAKRWVVKRTFSWLKRQKRLARDYEVDPHHGRSMVFIGVFKIILNRLA
jgi:transposase